MPNSNTIWASKPCKIGSMAFEQLTANTLKLSNNTHDSDHF